MTASSTFHHDSTIDRIFAPVLEIRTYKNLLYLAISMPLGILYFVTMITGLAISAGLAVIVVGFGMLWLTLAAARGLGRMERELTKALLGTTFEPRPTLAPGWKAQLTDRYAWTTVVFLLVRFPIGVASFITSVLFVVSIPVMAAPVLYTLAPFAVENSQEALLVSLFGCVLFLISAHFVNGLASISRRLAMALL